MIAIKQYGFILFLLASRFSGFTQQADQSVDDSTGIVVTQNSTYIMPGQWLEINVFSTCNTNSGINKVLIGGMSVSLRKNGVATFGTPGNSIGLHKIPIEVSFTNSEGELKYKTDTVEYTVGQAHSSIALDKMNVLYIGVDNPISVAASGGGDDKITVSIEGGGGLTSKIGAGRYMVRVKSLTDECIISLYLDGRIVGASRFRVRNIPVPIGTVGGFTSGDTVVSGAFRAQQGVGAYMKDFPFDISYEVIGYTVNIQDEKGLVKSANSQGTYFSAEVKQLIKDHLKPGHLVVIGNLFAKGPDGKTMKLSPLIYHIK